MGLRRLMDMLLSRTPPPSGAPVVRSLRLDRQRVERENQEIAELRARVEYLKASLARLNTHDLGDGP